MVSSFDCKWFTQCTKCSEGANYHSGSAEVPPTGHRQPAMRIRRVGREQLKLAPRWLAALPDWWAPTMRALCFMSSTANKFRERGWNASWACRQLNTLAGSYPLSIAPLLVDIMMQNWMVYSISCLTLISTKLGKDGLHIKPFISIDCSYGAIC